MHKARPLTDKEYAECFNVYKKISTEWEAIQAWLTDDFLPCVPDDKSLAVLSVGSGTGDFDLALMRLLGGKIPHIAYTALDPNRGHNRIFRRRYKNGDIHVDSLKIIPQPFGREKISGNFDVIHLTHCLYYIPDRKAAINHAWELLNPGGSILVFHQTALGINEIQRAFMRRVKGNEKEMFSAYDIMKLLDNTGIPYQHDILISDLDVTDCVLENKTGTRLLSFLLECHIENAEDALREESVLFLKENCRIVDGQYFLFHPGSIFWIRKELQ